ELPKFTPAAVNNTLNVLLNYKLFIGMVFAGHSLSRLMGVTVLQQYEYVTADADSKSKPVTTQRLSLLSLGAAVLFGVLPMVLLPPVFLLAILPVLLTRFWLAAYFHKWIGGYTGDCLGALQQVSEIVFYLFCYLIWTYF
ncbi:MAG: adenosylcobinamide-GDP ribazoletransferase, partial [Bacteroidetes bacterium]|nr:adenosylcobinamide-GDP ribazoletransferase [Bacteroidota bacterium]